LAYLDVVDVQKFLNKNVGGVWYEIKTKT
jgi:hypothetical protein